MDTESLEMGSMASLKTPPDKENEKQKPRNLDRGYAWVVMFAVFGSQLFQSPLESVNTIVYQEILVRFQINAATAGWVLSWPSSIRFLSSPVVGLLYQKFSHRTVAMVGAGVVCSGLLTIGFAGSMWSLYTSVVVYGLGGNMLMMSSMIMLSLYFSKRRGTAMAFCLCGGTLNAVTSPHFYTRSFVIFGFTQTLVFMACVALQTFVTTSLYRPQVVPKSPTISDTATKSACNRLQEKTGVHLLARPVVVYFMVVVASLHVVLQVRAIFISGLAFECINDMTMNEIATMISISSLAAFVKLPLGFCFDLQTIRPYRMYVFGMLAITGGALGIALPFITDKIMFSLCFVVFTVFLSGAHSQYMNILAFVVDIEQLANALALTRTLVGIILLFGAPSVGKIKDTTGSFRFGFIIINTVHICIVTGYLIVYWGWSRCKNRRKECAGDKVQST